MLSIVIEDNVFVTSNKNLISTKLYIRYNDRVFPNDKWTDFTFPILEEWKNNLVGIRNNCHVMILCRGRHAVPVKISGSRCR